MDSFCAIAWTGLFLVGAAAILFGFSSTLEPLDNDDDDDDEHGGHDHDHRNNKVRILS
jgi:hypothetical protein